MNIDTTMHEAVMMDQVSLIINPKNCNTRLFSNSCSALTTNDFNNPRLRAREKGDEHNVWLEIKMIEVEVWDSIKQLHIFMYIEVDI